MARWHGPPRKGFNRILLPAVWAFVLAASTLIAAEPVRIALPPAPRASDKADDAQRAAICLSLYLQECLQEMPGVRLVSEERSGAILDRLRGGACDLEKDELIPSFSEAVPVDAVVEYTWRDDKVLCALHTAAGIRRLELPFASDTSASDLASSVAQFLTKELALGTDAAAVFAQRRTEKRTFFEPYYVSQRLHATWIVNTGETRLKMMQPCLTANPASSLVAERVLHNAQDMLDDRRKTDFLGNGLTMAWVALPLVLGTPREESAHAILRSKPQRFESDLLAMATPLGSDWIARGLEEGLDDIDGESGGLTAMAVSGRAVRQPGQDYATPSAAQRLGALRCLGVIDSRRARDLIGRCAVSEDAETRAAAAYALQHGTGGDTPLRKLAADKVPAVAFRAAFGLWKRHGEAGGLLALARSLLSDPSLRLPAADVLSRLGTEQDTPALVGLSHDPDPGLRAFAVAGLLRLDAADADRLLFFLRDPDTAVVAAAVAGINRQPLAGAVAERLKVLANDPDPSLAQTTRGALAAWRPERARDRDLFDLETEHHYIRLKIVDALAANPAAWAFGDLEKACANRDAHTRARALVRLAERDPDRGRSLLAEAVSDPHRWVRLHAAARLADLAGPDEAAALRVAVAREPDAAIRLYLADALARAEGKPFPASRPAVHPVAGKKNLSWLCGFGDDVANSPAEAYYTCAVPTVPSEAGQRAYRAGKIIYPRVNTVWQPWRLVTDPAWQDTFWVVMHKQLTPETLPWCDGIVFGEESMSSDTKGMWEQAWRLFCRDAGIDPRTIGGDIGRLDTYQARAWAHWSKSKVVDGFNILYDYVKLYYGKLRPGIQVATFLPDQGGTTPADKRWKFDVAGCYRYVGSNRRMYTIIRRHKTLWPDRPIIWLSNGNPTSTPDLIGGFFYNRPFPTNTITARWERPYADNVSAWLAGADSGWFSIWCFKHPKSKGSGVWVHQEDIFPGSAKLERGIEFAFTTADDDYRRITNMPSVSAMTLDGGEDGELLELDEHRPEDDPVTQRIQAEKDRMRTGFLLYGKYVRDCMRVFADLPRVDMQPAVLTVWPMVWGKIPGFPALDLFNAYDYVPDINQAACDLELSRYRLIAVSGFENALLADATIANLTEWLRAQPGLLMVHGTLPVANTNELSTADDHDGLLKHDWPWEGDVTLVASNYHLTGPRAQVLTSAGRGPTRVLWTDSAFKGAVLFDTGRGEAADTRRVLNNLYVKRKIGMMVGGPMKQESWSIPGLEAASSYASADTNVLRGIDLLTGEANPSVSPGRNAAIVAREFTGKYTACWNGVAILCDRPIEKVEPVEGGLRVRCAGLIRVGSQSGAVTVRREDGAAIPALSGSDRVTQWILAGTEEGQATVPVGETGSESVYVRCARPVTFTRREKAPTRE